MTEMAVKKLEQESKALKGDRYVNLMKDAVAEALISFCRQDREFAQAVVQGGSFGDCMKAVAKNCGSALSDLEAYRRAVAFYFLGADVRMTLTVNLCASVEKDEPKQEQAMPIKTVVLDLFDIL